MHPRISVDWCLVDDPGDLVAGGYDVWIRAGPIYDESLIVRELGRSPHLLVGTASFPVVEHPQDIAGLNAVHLTQFTSRQISMHAEDGRQATLRIKPIFTTNSLYAAFTAVRCGVGYGVLPRWLVSNELSKQSLFELCPGWRPPEVTLSVAYPQVRHRPARIRAFVEYLREATRRPELLERLGKTGF